MGNQPPRSLPLLGDNRGAPRLVSVVCSAPPGCPLSVAGPPQQSLASGLAGPGHLVRVACDPAPGTLRPARHEVALQGAGTGGGYATALAREFLAELGPGRGVELPPATRPAPALPPHAP